MSRPIKSGETYVIRSALSGKTREVYVIKIAKRKAIVRFEDTGAHAALPLSRLYQLREHRTDFVFAPRGDYDGTESIVENLLNPKPAPRETIAQLLRRFA